MPINRHDILIAFDVLNGNPNGDPDSGNLPRIEPNSGKGLVSDVCLKRKVRNFVSMFPPDAAPDGNQFKILVQQGNVLSTEITKGVDAVSGPQTGGETAKAKKKAKGADGEDIAAAAMKHLCRTFFDVRAFGGVLAVGPEILKGSAHGQVRGPIQFTLGMSADPIRTQEITITRCVVTKEEDAAKERTMGHKHIVPYGLYVAKAFISPTFADRTGFDDADLELFFQALTHLFSVDQSAARAEMTVRAVFAFEHVGKQPDSNARQNRREQQLGCAHSHKLFQSVVIKKKEIATSFPTGFDDYSISLTGWREDGLNSEFPGVRLHRLTG